MMESLSDFVIETSRLPYRNYEKGDIRLFCLHLKYELQARFLKLTLNELQHHGSSTIGPMTFTSSFSRRAQLKRLHPQVPRTRAHASPPTLPPPARLREIITPTPRPPRNPRSPIRHQRTTMAHRTRASVQTALSTICQETPPATLQTAIES